MGKRLDLIARHGKGFVLRWKAKGAKVATVAGAGKHDNAAAAGHEEEEEFESHSVCNICNHPIIGARFHCLECPEYDQCFHCFHDDESHHHHDPSHHFRHIVDPNEKP